MAAIDLKSAAEQSALDYCRNVERELGDFSAYFAARERYDAVDSAVLNFVRMRVAILSEHLDLLERASAPADLVDAIRSVNTACCDFLVAWAPQDLPLH